ncbi:MAG: 4Fe-4S binding protein [Candidatus Omnitrophica bacterium]|nr:4Fe-4S binding protein [Candidatus Omnitrophota bacterium]
MAKRKIIKIDEEKCDGCGLCIPNCPEGALQIIDGKARIISDLFCDGLGACIGHCPRGAITTEEREAEAYDEKKVMENIVKQGESVIKAHLEHLKDHNEKEYIEQAIKFMEKNNINIPAIEGAWNEPDQEEEKHPEGCPGARMMDFSVPEECQPDEGSEEGKRSSQIRQWPVQLHLVPPNAPYFKDQDVLLVADCVAYSLADFHKDYLKGKSLAIACPKLDTEQKIYIEKITALIDQAEINTLTVMTMEVPCCAGLLMLAKTGAEKAERKVPIRHINVGIKGNILKDEWM